MRKHILFKVITLAVLCVMVFISGCQTLTRASSAIPTRDKIADQYKWRLEDIYASNDLWEQDFVKAKGLISALNDYKGKLAESAATLLAYLSRESEAYILENRLYVYAGMRKDEDLTNTTYQGMADRAGSQWTELDAATAFARPEILAIDDAKLAEFLKNKDLAVYKIALDNITRVKPHTLSDEEEKILALSLDLVSAPQTIYEMLTGADFTWPTVKDENGKEVELSYARYSSLLDSTNRQVRADAYKAFLAPYISHKNTLAALYASEVKAHIFNAKARGYSSSLEAALDVPNIPVSVYNYLIDAVNENLAPLQNWIALKKKTLKLDEMRPYDLFLTLFPKDKQTYTYEQAKALLREAFKPLGAKYLAIMEEGFNGGWIDLYATANKTSGAYSWGSYDTHPYMLFNFSEELSLYDVLTLAHEMGHAIHSYLSNKNQPYVYSQYVTFVAEVASTTNEVLVLNYLLKNADESEKSPVLEEYLSLITNSFYTQVRFAEFEKITNEKAENGEALTPDMLASLWAELYQKYYGPAMKVTDVTGASWADIPHFYYDFYVYSYATSVAAAETLAQKLLAGDSQAVDAYIELLSGGNADYPVNLLKKAGVDMTSAEPVNDTTQKMAELVKQVETILNK